MSENTEETVSKIFDENIERVREEEKAGKISKAEADLMCKELEQQKLKLMMRNNNI